MSDGSNDRINNDGYWRDRFYDMVEVNKKLERKIKRLETKVKLQKKRGRT